MARGQLFADQGQERSPPSPDRSKLVLVSLFRRQHISIASYLNAPAAIVGSHAGLAGVFLQPRSDDPHRGVVIVTGDLRQLLFARIFRHERSFAPPPRLLPALASGVAAVAARLSIAAGWRCSAAGLFRLAAHEEEAKAPDNEQRAGADADAHRGLHHILQDRCRQRVSAARRLDFERHVGDFDLVAAIARQNRRRA